MLANRSGDGDVLGFNFAAAGDTFVGGESSALLIFGSNATEFKNSTLFVINGGIQSADSLAPDERTVTAPDGGTTAILLSLGMFALAGIRRK